MTDHVRAVYEYLSAVPCIEGGPGEAGPMPPILRKREAEMKKLTALKMILFAMASLAVCPAWAVDGVVLIDQNRAIAGSVTGGDLPGYPVTISQPGSYQLSGNLTVPDGVHGIEITASNVTLNLNGFAIVGPPGSALPPETVNPQIRPRAISVTAPRNVTILNGTVTQMIEGIVFSGITNGRVERVRAIGNVAKGIQLSGNGTITDCIASNNTVGIIVNGTQEGPIAGSTLRYNDANNNSGIGIAVDCNGVGLIGNTIVGSPVGIHTSGDRQGCFFANNFIPVVEQ
jgi:parallel beta-helix repeat protein